jgi:hypothetical protein
MRELFAQVECCIGNLAVWIVLKEADRAFRFCISGINNK